MVATIQNKGIHVVTQDPVTIYGLDLAVSTSDAFLALPVSALGTEYINLGYQNTFASISHIEGTQFLVVAPEDNTQVTLVPGNYTGSTAASTATISRPNGTSAFNLGNTDGRDIGLFTTDAAGTYTLSVRSPYAGYSGTYNFELVDLATAAVSANVGQRVALDFATGREAKVVAFDIVAGQQLYIDTINPNPAPNVVVAIVSPVDFSQTCLPRAILIPSVIHLERYRLRKQANITSWLLVNKKRHFALLFSCLISRPPHNSRRALSCGRRLIQPVAL